MTYLLLEASTELGCIALLKNGAIHSFLPLKGGRSLSHELPTIVDDFLKKEQTKLSGIAVGIGPGSYTGIRVAVSFAQALGFGLQIPVYGFCSMAVFSTPTLFDAKMGGFHFLTSKENKPLKISLDEAEKILEPYSKIGSPHPEDILKRLPFLEGKLFEKEPNPESLYEVTKNLFEHRNTTPLSIIY